jgi:type VI secretion system ImpM family protein
VSGFRWFIYGKHPKFADYFTIGEDTQFTAAYKKWVTLGFQKHMNDKGTCEQVCSYRFWSQGDSDQTLAVGLLQSSTDSLRRPFPLLFIGIAQLPGWQKHWDNFDKQLVQIWESVEEIARGRHDSLQNISAELTKISAPVLSEYKHRQHCSDSTPNAVFTGGCGEKSTQFRFSRPLTKQDFAGLWNLEIF